jgi:hypothetical protein
VMDEPIPHTKGDQSLGGTPRTIFHRAGFVSP